MVIMGYNGEEVLCMSDDRGNLIQCFDNIVDGLSSKGEPHVFPPKIYNCNFVVRKALKAMMWRFMSSLRTSFKHVLM